MWEDILYIIFFVLVSRVDVCSLAVKRLPSPAKAHDNELRLLVVPGVGEAVVLETLLFSFNQPFNKIVSWHLDGNYARGYIPTLRKSCRFATEPIRALLKLCTDEEGEFGTPVFITVNCMVAMGIDVVPRSALLKIDKKTLVGNGDTSAVNKGQHIS